MQDVRKRLERLWTKGQFFSGVSREEAREKFLQTLAEIRAQIQNRVGPIVQVGRDFGGPAAAENQDSLKQIPPTEQGMFPGEDGTSLFYEVRGEGRPLIFCYGLTCRRDHWHYQIEEFAKRYQVISFDYRGHHRSALPANENHLTISWCARDVRSLIQYLNLSETVLFGHSMGVPVVTQAAQLSPDTVKAMVLICGGVTNPFEHMFHSNRLDPVYRASAWLFENAPDSFAWAWQRLTRRNPFSWYLTKNFGFNPKVSEHQDILMYLEGVSSTPLTTFHHLLNDFAQSDGREGLKSIACPTLVIAGNDDFITPVSVQTEMAELLPKGEIKEIVGGSHNAHMDFPEITNAAIQDFLSRNGF